MVVITSSMFNVLPSLLRMIEVYNIIQIHSHVYNDIYYSYTYTVMCVYIIINIACVSLPIQNVQLLVVMVLVT